MIEYTLPRVPGAEPLYRLVTTILDPDHAPASELAALYHERWEIEGAFDELKTHLRGARIVLRSKTPALVRQEVYGLLLAHYAVRGLMHEASLVGERSPSSTSFESFVVPCRSSRPFPPQDRTKRQRLHQMLLLELLDECVVSSRGRAVPRGVRRKMTHCHVRPRRHRRNRPVDYTVRITK